MKSGILQRMLQPKEVSKRGFNESSLLSFGMPTRSGIAVTQSSALSATAVWACVRVLSESVAQLPLQLYQRVDKGKVRAVNHPVYELLHTMPNPEMTSFQLRRTMMTHLATWGNASCEIQWGNDGYPEALWPLMPNNTEPVRVGGELFFDIRMPDGKIMRLPAYRVWHVTGLGTDPLVGLSPVRQHMETIGLAQAMTAHGAQFFANGARPGLVIKHPGVLNDDATKRLRESITLAYEGLDNAYRTMILEEGMSIEKVGVPPDEAQFLGSREFQTVEIARIYNVPPHMIQHLAEATYNNIEHQGLQFVTNTLMPYLVNFEQTIARDLLVAGERNEYFAEHLVDGLTRGDIKTRYEAYSTGIQIGVLSINDVRGKENMDMVEGGDVHLVPLNLAPLGQQQAPAPQARAEACSCGVENHDVRSEALRAAGEPSDPSETQRKHRVSIARSLTPVFADAFGRATRRESKAVGRAAAKYIGQRSVEDFNKWVETFYEEFLPTLERDLTPAMLSTAQQAAKTVVDELGGDDLPLDEATKTFIDEFLRALGIDYILASKARIGQFLDDESLSDEEKVAAIETGITDWEDERANQGADLTAFEALNALVIHHYGRKGVRKLMWVAAGASCAFCRSISGKVIDIERFFVGEGEDIDLGAGNVMNVNRNKRHGPLHRGCDCQVQAVVEVS